MAVDSKGRKIAYPYVLPPQCYGANPTIAFSGTASEKQERGLLPLERVPMTVRFAGIANGPVKQSFKLAGFRVTKSSRWNVNWGNILDQDEFSTLNEFQRANHFPGTWELGTKANLYRNMAHMRRMKGEAFGIIPRFFRLPRDYDEYQTDVERNPARLYIQKPTNSSRGRGIKMVSRPKVVSRDTKDVLIQHYIDRPLLINKLKFDLRVYVAATSLDPLRLYIYQDGLTRFATEEYSESDLKNRRVHLTNVSVNKKSAKFVANESTEVESSGSKWSLRALRSFIEHQDEMEGKNGTWSVIWQQVHDVSVKAILSAECRMNVENKIKVPHRSNCFEVWGIDVMLDADYRAWLIEVNTCPSLAADSPLDIRVKTGMISDLMGLVGVVPYDLNEYKAEAEARKQARLTGLSRGRDLVGHQMEMPKTVKEAENMVFTGVTPDRLPDLIIEMEAEYERRGGWERAFPCVEDPLRYLDLFETPRTSNTMACMYLATKQGCKRPASSRNAATKGPWKVQ